MKTIKQLLMTVAVLLCSAAAGAHDFEVDGIYYKITSTENLTVNVTFQGKSYSTYTNEYSGDIVIPDSVEYAGSVYKIERINDYSFSGCTAVTSVTIPSSVTAIGEYAFYGCTSLENINIGGGVTNIGISAFQNCSTLASITIPKNVVEIYNWAFLGCISLKNVFIENGNSILDLGGGAASISLSSILFNDSPLESVYIGRNISYPVGTKQGNRYAYSPFKGQKTLKTCVISDSVTEIRESMFEGCSALENVVIPNSITDIYGYAFRDCSELKSLIIGKNVDCIWEYAFYNCGNLEKIYSLPRVALSCSEKVFSTTTYNNALLYVPQGREFAYSKTEPWSNFYIQGMKSYNVAYKIDGEVYETYSVECFAEIPTPDTPTKEGYTFMGWSEIPSYMPEKDIVINGSFAVNKYAVAYVVDGDTVATDSIAYGAEITPIAAPEKEGHTFSGWSKTPATMPANDIIIRGSFEINTYVVTYIVDGVTYATDSIVFNGDVNVISAPEKEGHTFSGWSYAPKKMPAENITISGSFAVNYYAVVYVVDGDTVATESIAYGSEITLISAPEKEGHTFSGWSEAPATMPANDIVINGSFSVNYYTLTYIVDGEEYKTEQVAYGDSVVLIDAPVKENYIFSGWSDAPAIVPAEDIIITGSFVHTSINSVSAEATVKVNGNSIALVGVENCCVAVYSTNGALVEKFDAYAGEEITLDKGVYIVRVGGKAVKVKL